MNAKQLQMTGVVIMLEDINVVVVEGGEFFFNVLKEVKENYWGFTKIRP